jgi:hypothetical protein
MGRQLYGGRRLRVAGQRTRCAADCCDDLECADFASYDGLTGEVDWSVSVTPPGAADACCDDIFTGVANGATAWTYFGGTGAGAYTDGLFNFCSGLTVYTYERAVTFVCIGDGTFSIALDVFVNEPGITYSWSWYDTFPEPFVFGQNYTVPFLAGPGNDVIVQCLYDTGGWTYGSATVSFTVPV